MQDKTVIVTGANAGIGMATAQGLAGMGARVVMVGRSQERLTAARDEIAAVTGSSRLDIMLADLASQASIHAFAAAFRQQYDRLDVLVNNAGGFFNKREETVDGLELTFALNHLGYFLPTLLLLDMLQDAGEGRIVNVSSDAHQGAELDLDDLQLVHGYSAFKAYGRSKLANVYFTYELARRLADSDVTVNALHPGFVASNFGKNNGVVYTAIMTVLGKVAGRSPAKGAETSIYLASSPDVAGVTGKYFKDCRETPSSDVSYDTAVAEQLWTISAQLTGLNVTV